MGDKSSKPLPSSPELQHPWRKVEWEEGTSILNDLENYKPNTGVLKILLCGPTGAGKSSFVNSVQRVLLRRNFIGALESSTQQGQSFTLSMRIHKLKKREGDLLPFEFVDIMGLQPEKSEGIHINDIIKILEGHILEGYHFNPTMPITEENLKYKTDAGLFDKVHCLVSVFPADSVLMMDQKLQSKFGEVRQKASQLRIPQVLVLTKVDKACANVSQNVSKIYHSRKIKEKVDFCSSTLGISLNSIYPVKNYHAEVTQDKDIDVLILMALRDIVNFANDYVEDLKRLGAV